jgi:uncharacterized protein DUF2834
MGQNRGIYLALAVIGAIVPAVLLGAFILDHGIDDLADAIFGNAAAAAVMADLSISSIVFWVWLWREAPPIGVSPWPFVAGNLVVGLCFALPLFLYVRAGKAAPA